MTSSNRTDTAPVRSGTKFRQQAQRKRRNVLVACLSTLTGIGLLAAVASSVQWHAAPESDREAKSANVAMPQTGTVVVQSDTQRCEVAKFDNQTGQAVDGFKPSCSNAVVLDSHGIPVPTGTIRRLDSISKSFSGSKN
jgi:hypothetical protein